MMLIINPYLFIGWSTALFVFGLNVGNGKLYGYKPIQILVGVAVIVFFWPAYFVHQLFFTKQ